MYVLKKTNLVTMSYAQFRFWTQTASKNSHCLNPQD